MLLKFQPNYLMVSPKSPLGFNFDLQIDSGLIIHES